MSDEPFKSIKAYYHRHCSVELVEMQRGEYKIFYGSLDDMRETASIFDLTTAMMAYDNLMIKIEGH